MTLNKHNPISTYDVHNLVLIIEEPLLIQKMSSPDIKDLSKMIPDVSDLRMKTFGGRLHTDRKHSCNVESSAVDFKANAEFPNV